MKLENPSPEIIHPEIIELQSVLDQLLSNRQQLKVLEAGCGSASYLKIGEAPYFVGIDISEKQLANNHDLQEKILGDLQTYNLPDSDYDVIVCWNVLEHLPQPELALKNFLKAIKEEGLIIIALPNLLSLWGIITKYTPLWFHTWVYKYIFGEKKAGKGDFGPFKTFLKPEITPESVKKFALNNGLSIKYFNLYENFRQEGVRKKLRLVKSVWIVVKGMIKVLTLGKIEPEHTDYIIVLKKLKTSEVDSEKKAYMLQN